MPKKIVFCADGTWNHPHSPVLVEQADTNVYKLYKLLAVTAAQLTFYDDGVGADGTPIEHLTGGAFGAGLFQKIKDGYTAIAHAYEAGDEIFIFGFSRGAYTARSLAGMIAICGVPTQNFDQSVVETAFRAYRHQDERAALLAGLASRSMGDARIRLLGVWDTVGALGIPNALFGQAAVQYGFLDTQLHPDVLNALQALSIDERRREFTPTLWTSAPAPGQVMKQVWFAGVHSDVGGGYAEEGLSDIALSWILEQGIACGLETLPAAAAYRNLEPKYALGPAHESWNLLWGFPERRPIPGGSALANSVNLRLSGEPGYRPPNLRLDAQGQPSGYATEAVIEARKADVVVS